MGAGIPLPALDVQQFQQESPATAMAKVEQVRAAQQQREAGELELQQKRLVLNDQQAMTQAMQEWDGKDMSQLPTLIMKHGGSANAVMGMRNNILDYQTKLSTLGKDQLELEGQKHDLVAGALGPLTDPKQVPDEQLPGTIHSTVQDLVQRGLIDPQHAQTAESLAQMPPDQARQQVEMLRKGITGQSAQVSQAATQAKTASDLAKAQGERFKYENGLWYDLSSGKPTPVNGNAANPQQFHDLIDQIAPPNTNRALNMRTKANVDFLLQQGRVQDAQTAINKAGEEVGGLEKELDPRVQANKIQVARQEAQARQQALWTLPGGGEAAASAGARGEDFLKSLPGNVADVVRQIGTGKMALSRIDYLLSRNPALAGAVSQAYPDFDSSKVKSYSGTYDDFTHGKTSVALNSGGTALGHLKELDELNTVASHIPHTPAWTAYQNKAATVSAELAKFYGDPTIPAINSIKDTLTSTLPGNRKAAITTQAQSMGDKLDAYEQQWHNAAPSAAYQAPLPGISESAKAARRQLDPAYAARENAAPKAGGGQTIHYKIVNGQLVQQ